MSDLHWEVEPPGGLSEKRSESGDSPRVQPVSGDSGRTTIDSAQRSAAPFIDSAQRSAAPFIDSAQRSGAQSLHAKHTGSKNSPSHPSRSAWRAHRRTQIALFPNRFRILCVLGVLLISVFSVFDFRYPWPSYVTLSQPQFLAIRGIWVSIYIALFATSYHRELDERLQTLRDYALCVATSAFQAALCAHTGRMASPYYGGILLLTLARCVIVPGELWRTVKLCLAIFLTWAAVTLLLPAPGDLPARGSEWRSILNSFFVVCGMGLAAIGAYWGDRVALGLEAAKLMGRYRLVRRLGIGGMGEVYLAYHASLRRPCAVKILKEELCEPLVVARFEREAEAASRLRHPNTIAVFDFGRTDEGRPYYVMEFLDGCDLGQLVTREGPLLPERAAYFLWQAARSLAEAHAMGMVHRDVKPGNLFVTRVGGQGDFVKVLDFGLVKGVDLGPELTRAEAFMGTPRYMAPEALSGQPVDCRADVYALGALGYCLLCGEPPFSSGDAYVDIYRQINDPPPPVTERRAAELPAPSAALQAVLMRCLHKDPAARFSDAGALAEALEGTPEHGQWRPAASAPVRGEDVGSAQHAVAVLVDSAQRSAAPFIEGDAPTLDSGAQGEPSVGGLDETGPTLPARRG